MREYESFSEQFADLTDHFVEPGSRAAGGREYREMRAAAHEAVTADPEQAAQVIEFIFRNNADPAKRREAVGLLRRMADIPEYQGRATELLGMAMQDPTADVAGAAARALRGALRSKLP